MQKIKKLSSHEAQKIAAGEVIERPANIIKELLENAVDAGATQVSLHIADGGKKLIRVTDNGCGMSPEDAQLCFEKHATSKIEKIDQLDSITTFGFRGEALASIAAVAKVTLITKEEITNEGTKLQLEHGEVVTQETAPHTTGTDITVSDLFFNIPARKKFLKKAVTEYRHIQQLFHAFCYDYPHIHFKFFSENKLLLNCPPVATFVERCKQLWDKTTTSTIIEFSTQRDNGKLTISGAISHHHYYRYDRSGIFFFVNKRWIKNIHLSKALLKGYSNVLPNGRFPAACINITIEPHEVDINIHPRKEEVKFLHPLRLEQLLQGAVKQALDDHLSATIKSTVQKKSFAQQSSYNQALNAFRPQKDFIPQNAPFIPKPEAFSTRPQQATYNSFIAKMQQEQTADKIEQKDALVANRVFQQTVETHSNHFKLLGQYNKTYLLIEKDNGLFFIDQHAAHERILYEEFKKRFENIPTITLLFPQMISISQHDMQIIEPHLDIFTKHGITIEPFGTDQIIIHATPVHLKNIALDDLIKQVVGWITEYQNLDTSEFFKTIHEKLHAQMACKAAVKAGDILTHEQMHKLITDLQKVENRLTCPHGRPTGWLLELNDIEKRFKRDYKGKV